MNNLTISICIVGFVLLAGCNDKDADPLPIQGIPKIKTESGNGATTVYEQDSQGRVTLSSSPWGRSVYTYSPGTATRRSYDAAGNLTSETFYDLNSAGHVTRITYTGSVARYTMTYNSAGQTLTEHYYLGPSYDSTDSYYHYSSTGRLDSVRRTKNASQQHENTTIYEYSENRPLTYGDINFGFLYYGNAKSPNPYTKVTIRFANGTVQTDNYSFEYDDKNRIIKRTTGSHITTYTYY